MPRLPTVLLLSLLTWTATAGALTLTDEEHGWLADHPELRLGVDASWPPFEYRDEEGRYQGLAADYVRLIQDRLGIKVKLIEPGGVRTDFAGRSLDFMHQPGLDAYDASLKNAMLTFSDPQRARDYSDASHIAEVIYRAATDGCDQFRYLAGKDAVAMAARRAALSDEDYRTWALEEFHL